MLLYYIQVHTRLLIVKFHCDVFSQFNQFNNYEQFSTIVVNMLALTVNINKKGFLRMISEVIQTMFKKPTTPFWSGRAMDLLFDGIISKENYFTPNNYGGPSLMVEKNAF